MANKNRNKGNYHEKWFVSWLKVLGFKAKRQPLSGQLGGEYRGDILWDIGGNELVVEVKYRDASSFPNAFAVLQDRDIAFFKRKTGHPKTCVIIEGDVFARYFAPILTGDEKPKRRKRQIVPEDWQPTTELKNDINMKLKEDIDHDDEAARFCDYYISTGKTLANFDLAYRNWCRNSVKFRAESQGSRSNGRGGKPQYSRSKPDFFAGVHNRLSSD